MLTAIIVLGLLPLAAMPFLQEDTARVDDADIPDNATVELENTPLEHVVSTPEPLIYKKPAGPGPSIIADFKAGHDILEIDLTPLDLPISCMMGGSELGSSVGFDTNDGDSSRVLFQGLTELPIQDIILKLANPGSGTPIGVSLYNALDAGDVKLAQPSGESPIKDALSDETAPQTEAEPEIDVDRFLDKLRNQNDKGLGQLSDSRSELSASEPLDPPAAEVPDSMEQPRDDDIEIVDGFRPGQDVLRIDLPLSADQAMPVLEVKPSPDGRDGQLFVDGDLICILQGAPDATEADVVFEAS